MRSDAGVCTTTTMVEPRAHDKGRVLETNCHEQNGQEFVEYHFGHRGEHAVKLDTDAVV